MKKLIIIFAIVLLIAGATIGAMKFLGLGPFAEPETAEQQEAPKEREPEALFVDMEPIMINVMQGGEMMATIQLEIKLETAGRDNIIQIKRMLPQYKNAFMQDLHAFVPRMFREIERMDLPTVKQRLQLISDRVAGETGIVNGVLIQSIVDTPLQQQ